MFRVSIYKEGGTKNNNISLEEISKVICPQLVEMLQQKKLLSTAISKSSAVMYTFSYTDNA
ncbi:hypothetical protein N9481_04745 [Pelagibacteraceae bacterium]|nr:hypothetical protein [Pelagibacteraceae bacterium]